MNRKTKFTTSLLLFFGLVITGCAGGGQSTVNPGGDDDPQVKTKLATPRFTYNNETNVISWSSVSNAYAYLVSVDSQGIALPSSTLSYSPVVQPNVPFSFKMRAEPMSGSTKYDNSDWTQEVTLTYSPKQQTDYENLELISFTSKKYVKEDDTSLLSAESLSIREIKRSQRIKYPDTASRVNYNKVSLEATVYNETRDSFVDLVLYISSLGQQVVFNEGNGEYQCKSTTVNSGGLWVSKISFDLELDFDPEEFTTYIEIKEINFLRGETNNTKAILNNESVRLNEYIYTGINNVTWNDAVGTSKGVYYQSYQQIDNLLFAIATTDEDRYATIAGYVNGKDIVIPAKARFKVYGGYDELTVKSFGGRPAYNEQTKEFIGFDNTALNDELERTEIESIAFPETFENINIALNIPTLNSVTIHESIKTITSGAFTRTGLVKKDNPGTTVKGDLVYYRSAEGNPYFMLLLFDAQLHEYDYEEQTYHFDPEPVFNIAISRDSLLKFKVGNCTYKMVPGGNAEVALIDIDASPDEMPSTYTIASTINVTDENVVTEDPYNPPDLSLREYDTYQVTEIHQRGITGVVPPLSEGGSNYYGPFSYVEKIVYPQNVRIIEHEYGLLPNLKSIEIPNQENLESANINLGQMTAFEFTSEKLTYLYARGTHIKNFVIPDTVTEGGCNFTSIQNLTIGKLFKSLEYSTYAGAVYNEIKFTNTLTKFVNNSEEITFIPNAFFSGTRVQEVDLGGRITTIPIDAFYQCAQLYKLTGIESVTSIEKRAFAGCYYLYDFEIPSGLTSIGDNAFSDCQSIETFVCPNTLKMIGNYAFQQCTFLTSITLNEGLVSIGSNAFKNCSDLKTITFPSTLETIGDSAFAGCTSIESITIPAGVSVASNAFGGLTGLKTLIIGPNVVFDTDAFKGTTNIENIVISDNGNITASMFAGSKSLKSVTIGENVTIEDGAFQDCSSLEEITLPNDMQRIPDKMFYGCSSLKTIHWGTGVKEIGKYAFYGCNALTDLSNLPDQIERIEYCAFYGPNITKLHIPTNLQYLNADFAQIDLSLYEYPSNFPDYLYVEEGKAYIPCKGNNHYYYVGLVSHKEDAYSGMTQDNHNWGSQYVFEANDYSISSETVIIGPKSFTRDIGHIVKQKGEDPYMVSVPFVGGNYVVSTSVKEIGKQAFAGRSFNTFEVPTNCTYIGPEVFSNTSMELLTIRGELEELMGGVFNNANIDTITVESARIIRSNAANKDWNILYSINNLIVKNGVEIIEDNAVNTSFVKNLRVNGPVSYAGADLMEYATGGNNPSDSVTKKGNGYYIGTDENPYCICIKRDRWPLILEEGCNYLVTSNDDNLYDSSQNYDGYGYYIGKRSNPYFMLTKMEVPDNEKPREIWNGDRRNPQYCIAAEDLDDTFPINERCEIIASRVCSMSNFNIVVPDSVRVINTRAFYCTEGNTGWIIQKITFGKGLRYLGASLFYQAFNDHQFVGDWSTGVRMMSMDPQDFKFNGTMAEYKSILRELNWCTYLAGTGDNPILGIYCTDGYVPFAKVRDNAGNTSYR